MNPRHQNKNMQTARSQDLLGAALLGTVAFLTTRARSCGGF